MKYFFALLIAFVLCLEVSAQSPAESFMSRFEDVKGAKCIKVKGNTIVFARPALKRYPIAPMSDSVNEIAQLNMGKTAYAEKQRLVSEMDVLLKDYRYYGKSYTPEGVVDVYVHMKSEDVVDELVVFNPEKYVLSILKGIFPVEELLKLYKGKTDKN